MSDYCPRVDRPVIVITSGVIDRAALERFGALVLETSDASLLVSHLAHALSDPWPEHGDLAPIREREEPPEALDFADCPEPALCKKCGAEVAVTSGKGQHLAQSRCPKCRAHRWVGRDELRQLGIDPKKLTTP